MTPIDSLQSLQQLLAQYPCRGAWTNNYLLPADYDATVSSGRLYALPCGHNLCLMVDQGHSYRVYYHIGDPVSPVTLEADKPLVMEIPYRGADTAIAAVRDYWERGGFAPHITRDLYSAVMTEPFRLRTLKGLEVAATDRPQDGQYALELFDQTFDLYTGDHLDCSMMDRIVADGNLLVARRAGVPLAALHQYQVGKTAWIGHLAVDPSMRGCGMGALLTAHFVNLNLGRGTSRFSQWVMRDNDAARRMYEGMGWRLSGKSSLSMIKTQQ